jgi:Repeat of unknown function (DUF5648)
MRVSRARVGLAALCVSVALGLALPAMALAIPRDDVLARAQSWVSAKVPYDQGGYYGGYRTDCSGFVSMSWGLGKSYVTWTLPQVSHQISKNELLPGDILLRPHHHVVLFAGWADAGHTQYVAFEETPPKAITRVIPYPYWPGHGTYTPYRYNSIEDTPSLTWTVYRFRNLKNGSYLWTANEIEKNKIQATMTKTWKLEGVAYRITKLTNTSPLWRFRNLKGGFYFYTSDPNEKSNIVAKLSKSYKLEGVAYNVSRSAGSPVWRFQNLKNGTYLFTSDPAEKANIVAELPKTWKLEGVAYMVTP